MDVCHMIKNIVFDIGNVLVTFLPAQHFLPYFKDEEKTKEICQKVFSHEAWEKYDQGLNSMKDLHEIYQRECQKQYKDIAYILNNWMELMHLIPETLAYMKELKARGYHVYLLSNISKDSADYLKAKMPFFELADGIIGDNYPVPDRMLVHIEKIVNKYLLKELCGNTQFEEIGRAHV